MLNSFSLVATADRITAKAFFFKLTIRTIIDTLLSDIKKATPTSFKPFFKYTL